MSVLAQDQVTLSRVDDGEEGFSPIATVTKTGDTATITITDKTGTTEEVVSDGADGEDGFSPTVSTSKTGTVTTVTITDKDGPKTATINDGEKGDPGTPGVSATSYDLIVSHGAISKSITGAYNPSSITLQGSYQTGADPRADYYGRFKIETTTNNTSWTTTYTSSTNEAAKVYTIPNDILAVRFSLYLAGGTTTLLDQQTVPIVNDGATGKGVASRVTYYYLSTSNTSQSGGSWSTTPQTYVNGRYYWTYEKTTYTDGSSVDSTPVLDNALTTANKNAYTADQNAASAVTKADGKSTLYHQASQPSGGTYRTGDTWFDTDDGYKMYTWNGSNWVAEQYGTNAISAGAIKAGNIDAGAVTTAKISAGAITANLLASDAIKSTNYVASPNPSSPYSATGTFLDLSTGNIYTPNFGVDSANGAAYIFGTINANSGRIGHPDAGSYWSIGTVTDYDANNSAAIESVGSAYIQSGNWQLSGNSFSTRSYDSNRQITYLKSWNTYYDYGLKVPTINGSAPSKYWLYQRHNTGSIPALDVDWTYPFWVDYEGNLSAKSLSINGTSLYDIFASKTDVGSDFLPKTGGTITGNLTVTGTITGTASKASALATAGTIQTDLASTSAVTYTNGGNITPGIKGTLGVGHGGTGQTSAINAANSFLNALSTGSNTPVDADYFISQYVGGGTTTTTYHRRPVSKLWEYIKGKADSVYFPFTGGTVIGDFSVEGEFRATDESYLDSANIGNLVVTGSARFTNDILGNAETATTATKVGHTFKVQLNGGTTEGTNMFSFDGSANKSVNITKNSIGLGNVENKSSATIRGELTSANVTTALGFTPTDNVGTVTKISTGVGLTGGDITGSGTIKAKLKSETASTLDAAAMGSTSSRQYAVGVDKSGYLSVNIPWVAYESKAASSGGTAVSLVTTGEKYTWNNKTSNTGTVTSIVAGTGLTGGTISISGTIALDTTYLATNGQNGLMSKDDKAKLDQITVSDIGTVGADSIKGATNGGIDVSITTGVATLKHTNQLSSSGTISGTATSTLSNGGNFKIPSITYDINGHIVSTTTTTITLPTITKSTISLGNVDNTSDADKPISTATQTALDEKADKDRGIEFIRGTWTATSGTWTGVTVDSELYDGKKIILYLPYAGSGNATLNLTLADGTTTTGAKNCYYTSTTRLATHYGQYACVGLIYHRSHNINGTNYEGWWVMWDRDTTINYQVRYYNNIHVLEDISANSIIVGTSAGYKKLVSGVTFDLDYPILWCNHNRTANTQNGAENYLVIQSKAISSIVSGVTGVNKSELYLTVTLSGNTATVVSPVLTCTKPTSANGIVYIPIGLCYSSTSFNFDSIGNRRFQFINGAFQEITGAASYATTAGSATSATSAINATNATNATKLKTFTSRQTTANTLFGDGYLRYFISTSNMTEGKPVINGEEHDSNILSMAWDNTGGYDSQIAQHNTDGALAVRGMSKGTWCDWRTVLDDGNFDNYALPLTGGILTGNLSIKHTTSSTVSYTDLTNPRITFTNNAGEQGISLIYTDYDTYQSPASVTLVGASSGAYFISPNIKATQSIQATNYIAANIGNSGSNGGVALYGTNVTNYGIAARTSADSGTHGFNTGGWNTYFYIKDTTSDTNRGWIFKNTDTAIASISGEGDMQLDGKLRVGGDSGCTEQYNETTKALDFIFV